MELKNLNPFSCFNMKNINTSIAKAKQIGLCVGHMQRLRRPHDLLNSTTTTIYIYINTQILNKKNLKNIDFSQNILNLEAKHTLKNEQILFVCDLHG